jgi:uncharacterized protein (DUF1800 family)
MARLNRKSFILKAAQSVLDEKPKPAAQAYTDPSNKTLPADLRKTTTGIDPYTGTWGFEQTRHLVRRALFGATKVDTDFFEGMTMTDAVDFILSVPPTLPDPPINHYSNDPNFPDIEVSYGQTWVTAAFNIDIEGQRLASFKAWSAGLLINQSKNIREKMTLFWHNHFATQSFTIFDSRYVYRHHSMLRQNCLGNFKSLVKQVTIDPAMLQYLNGYANTKAAPDENYSRELQELFTVGKDLPSHYTEDDVKQAARVLTGWTDNRTLVNSSFVANKHDTGDKTFSAFYNNTVITGRTGTAGADETDDLINMIFTHQEVSKYICRKLYRYFVYYVIDETVEQNVIEPLAEIFRNNNYEILPVLETLFKSEHFYDPLNIGCVIKQPLDHSIGLCRQFNIELPATNADPFQLYTHWLFIEQFTALMQQDYGDPPNVAGWPAYWESPQYYEIWINSDSLSKRNILCDYLLYVGYDKENFNTKIDCIEVVKQFTTPADPNLLIQDLCNLIYVFEPSQTVKDSMKISFLLSGQSADHYWSDAWNTYMATPNDENAKTAVSSRLQWLMKYMLGQAEYQLC